MSSNVENVFNGLAWHDAHCFDFAFFRDERGEVARLTIAFNRGSETYELTQIDVLDVAFIDLKVDLDGKRDCSDNIAGAICRMSSEWFNHFKEERQKEGFEGYYHFRVALIPPGKAIDIVAKDCAVRAFSGPLSRQQMIARKVRPRGESRP